MEKEKKEKERIVYRYIHRSDVIADNMLDTLNEVYELARPKPEKSFMDMCKDIHAEAEKQGMAHDSNFRITYGKYTWPFDFFYIPHDVLKTVWDNRQEAFGIREDWKENMQSLVKFLFEEPGVKEVYKVTEYSNGKEERTNERQQLLKDVIGEENAAKVREILEDYMHTYRWGLRDVNQFGWGFLSTPTCNKETVINAWKEAFGKDVTIPDDSCWVDEYYDEDELDDEYDKEEED